MDNLRQYSVLESAFSMAAFMASYGDGSELARTSPSLYDLMIGYAREFVESLGETPVEKGLFDQITILQDRHLLHVVPSNERGEIRFWVSFWTSKTEIEPPFQIWISGQRGWTEDGDYSMVAVIDAASPQVVWSAIRALYGEVEQRFCTPKLPDWQPSDRFVDYEGKTSSR